MKSSELADCQGGEATPIHASRVTRRAFVKRGSILTVATSSLFTGLIHTAAGDEEDTTVTTGTTTAGTTGGHKMSCTGPAAAGKTVVGQAITFEVAGTELTMQVQLETTAEASTAKVPDDTYTVKSRVLRTGTPNLSNTPDLTLSFSVECKASDGKIEQSATGGPLAPLPYEYYVGTTKYYIKVTTEIGPVGGGYTEATSVRAEVKTTAQLLDSSGNPVAGKKSEQTITVSWKSDAHIEE